MTPESPVNLKKSIMPVAWTKSYTGTNGVMGRVFSTTMGASIDLLNEDLRRLIVNGCFWAIGMEMQIPVKADVDFISDYNPKMFGYGLFKKGMVPSNFELK
jgi:type 1 glutamine amidotransferase